MSTFRLSLDVKRVGNSDLQARISIENLSNQNCYINRDVIMLDGFKNDKFTILADSVQVPYLGRAVKYYPEKFLIKPQETSSHEVNLNSVYEINSADHYIIKYSTAVNCCLSFDELSCTGLEFLEVSAIL